MALSSKQVVNGDLLEVNVYCLQTNQISINRLHYTVTALTTPGVSVADCLPEIDTAIHAAYKDVLSSAAKYAGLSGRIVYPVLRKSTYDYNKTNAGDGTQGFNLMPRQVCGMFTKVSGVPGRKGRGRLYVPFPSTDAQAATGDFPTAGYMVNLGVLAAISFSLINVGVGASTCVLKPTLYHVADPSQSVFWVGATARRKWATHRSRGDYGKPNILPDGLL